MTEKLVVDSESIRKLAKLLEQTGLAEIEYQVGSQRVRLVRPSAPATPSYEAASLPSSSVLSSSSSPVSPPPPSPSAIQGEVLPSPMVGIVYLAGEPGAAPFIKVGDMVKKGDTLLIVEAMKVMNPIRAPRDGKVIEICVQDAKPIEFGEPLIILE